MNRIEAVAAGTIVLLAVVGGGMLVGGVSPDEVSPGDVLGGPSGETTAPDATATADAPTTAEPENETVIDSTPTVTTDGDADAVYNFTIERVTECGTTCRNVTARLANEATDAREDVRVTTGVFADGDLLWRGNETVGRLESGEAHTSTKRVELGLSGAMAVQDNDGYVTVVTVVQSADGTERFEDRRKVG